MAIEKFKDLFNSVIDSFRSDKTENEADESLQPVKKSFNDAGSGEPVLHKVVYPQEQEAVQAPKAEEPLEVIFTAHSRNNRLIVKEEPQPQEPQPQTKPKELSPLEIVARFFAEQNVSAKAEKTLESAMGGNDQAKKDLWYFINNKLEGVSASKELWKAGFELLQESAAGGNKQAISDLAYVKFHGIGGVKADPEEALESTKKLGFATKAEVFEHWQPGFNKDKEPEKPAVDKTAANTANAVSAVSEEKPGGTKLFSEEQVALMLGEKGFNPDECRNIYVPGGGKIINCQLEKALLEKGVTAPEEWRVEYKNPGYIVRAPVPQVTPSF